MDKGMIVDSKGDSFESTYVEQIVEGVTIRIHTRNTEYNFWQQLERTDTGERGKIGGYRSFATLPFGDGVPCYGTQYYGGLFDAWRGDEPTEIVKTDQLFYVRQA